MPQVREGVQDDGETHGDQLTCRSCASEFSVTTPRLASTVGRGVVLYGLTCSIVGGWGISIRPLTPGRQAERCVHHGDCSNPLLIPYGVGSLTILSNSCSQPCSLHRNSSTFTG